MTRLVRTKSRLSEFFRDRLQLYQPARLKNWTALSCFFAAAIDLNVPRFRRLPVLALFLRE